ncbi:MAG: hypothetical protein ACYTG7_08180 [Planctomycetota bacterium]
MDNRPRIILLHLVILALCAWAASGCAAFPGKQLPLITDDQIQARPDMPGISYSLKCLQFGNENARGKPHLRSMVKAAFYRANLFPAYVETDNHGGYHLEIQFENTGNLGLAFLSGFISGMTLLIVPGYAKDEYILTVTLIKDYQFQKQYVYEDHMSTWIQILLIFVFPFYLPQPTAEEIIDNMFMNLMYDLSRDEIFVTA